MDFKLYYLPSLPETSSNIASDNTPTKADVQTMIDTGFNFIDQNCIVQKGYLQSGDFVSGSSGWAIFANGDAEFNNGTFRGTITASAIDIGGSDATSFHVDIDGNMWLGAATFAAAPAKISNAGVATFTSVTATGTINATGGYIGSTTALVYESQGINTGTTGYIRGGQTAYNTGTGYFLGYSGGTYKFSIGDGGVSQYMTWNGTTLVVNDTSLTLQNLFGDGSDGAVTISVNTTLSSDQYYTTLTVNSGVTLSTGGHRIFCQGKVTINGTIDNSGVVGGSGTAGQAGFVGPGVHAPGVKGAGGAAGGSSFFLSGQAGAAGGDGQSGGGATSDGSNGSPASNGSNETATLGSNGSAGSAGGNGGNGMNDIRHGGTGGAAGTGGTATAAGYRPKTYVETILMRDFSVTTPAKFSTNAGSGGSGGGAGGGGGNGGNVAAGDGGGGGGGGGSAGILLICAKSIVVSVTGAIQAKGGAGGNGGAGGAGTISFGTNESGGGGGGGAGSGGGGGYVVLVYNSFSNSGTLSAAGGAAGTPGTGGAAGGANAQAGSNGGSGTAGTAGSIVQLQV